MAIGNVKVETVQEGKPKLITNEIQKVTVSATSGSYTLTFAGQTATIGWDASEADVQKALQALTTIGKDNIAVTRDGNVYKLEFIGKFLEKNQQLIVAGSGATVEEIQEGGFEFPAVNEKQKVTVNAVAAHLHYRLKGRRQSPSI